jgi:hypothetical protein
VDQVGSVYVVEPTALERLRSLPSGGDQEP